MKIVRGYPPNYSEIRAAFKEAIRPGVIFAYGDTIFNPIGATLSPSLIAHEEVHSGQQGDDPEGWWRRYIAESVFRFEQELAAHRAEYRVAIRDGSRHVRRSTLKLIASRLASPLYGCCVSIGDAKLLIAGTVDA